MKSTRRKPTGGEVWCRWIAACTRALNDMRDADGIEGLVASWAPGEIEYYAEMLREFRVTADRWATELAAKQRAT